MKTRKEKIDFLKRLSIGRTTMEEVMPANLSIDIGEKETTFTINKKPVTPEQFFSKMDAEKSDKPTFNVKII